MLALQFLYKTQYNYIGFAAKIPLEGYYKTLIISIMDVYY